MAKPIITIIGLGSTGAGMGLALQRQAAAFEIVGHDRSPEVAQAARKQGAVHRSEWNLHRACEGAELVILAVPLPAMDEVLGQIAEDLKPGTLVLGISGLLQPAIDLAAKHLPAAVQFVAGHPVLTGNGAPLAARPDLYERAVFALAASPQTEAAALQLASDFVDRVAATPLFVDPQEHDGIMAEVDQLPRLLAAVLMHQSSHSAGWREARRLAGRTYAGATALGENAAELFAVLQANRQNVAIRLMQFQQELATWAELLEAAPAEGQKHPLLAALEEAVTERSIWEAQAQLKNWEETPAPAQPPAEGGGFLRQMFLGGLGSRSREPRR